MSRVCVKAQALQRRGTQVVRERSAKPLCVGSIPTRASKSIHSTKCAMTFRSPRASGFQSPLWSRPCKVLAERWRIHYNTVHPHSSLGYRAPAPETLQRVEDLSVEELVTRLGVKAGTAGFDISVFAPCHAFGPAKASAQSSSGVGKQPTSPSALGTPPRFPILADSCTGACQYHFPQVNTSLVVQ